jgi:tRNA(adenine34) deaminase
MPYPPAHFMAAALRIAATGLDRGELPIGAVVVLGDEIIASAHTAERAERRLLVHAELLALDAADRLAPFPGRRRDVRLFTTLEPCLMCLGAAISFGLGEIHYALESPADGALTFAHAWQRDEAAMPGYRLPATQHHADEARQQAIALFRAYTERYSSGAMWEWAKTLTKL